MAWNLVFRDENKLYPLPLQLSLSTLLLLLFPWNKPLFLNIIFKALLTAQCTRHVDHD